MPKVVTVFLLCCMLPFVTAASSAPPRQELSSYAPIIRQNFRITKRVVVAITVDFISTQNPAGATFRGIGSGVIVHPDGIIFTNAHVVTAPPSFEIKEITIELWNGERFPLKKIEWVDNEKDMARLKIDTTFGSYAKIDARDFDNMNRDDAIGEEVITIGHPFGILQWDVSWGYITHPARKMPGTLYPFMELYLHVNPGNSGGGLFDSQGDLIGVPTALWPGSGISFAIPIKRFCDTDKENGFNACAQTIPEKAPRAPEHTPLFPYTPSRR
ncbi:MAG: hypothetical protein COU47_03415 [Candidatus Niyogibacteria bacterium CG10_big_fil_rev_8_21_14_0_10_46_36]|uniref:Serine protease n=1 Tax=Candidatus Niyogibacteria bacterium CG10_big_fil_rev_8_21_14_0_10_46_36 TaxID=1974726 RepID=A0A2H0TCW2_9BACT|nr:MAG: hypothetical protein COU47_03415 [Candidatus Niyogibacteria bacterium CG10_big_fil_rev_8_21_14_0_10_46_36]